MNAMALLLVAASVSVDFGWKAGPDGELEYIIQIDPLQVETLKEGLDITSRIPPEVRGVRSFRIRVGTDEVPRDGISAVNTSPATPAKPPAVTPSPAATVPVETPQAPPSQPPTSDSSDNFPTIRRPSDLQYSPASPDNSSYTPIAPPSQNTDTQVSPIRDPNFRGSIQFPSKEFEPQPAAPNPLEPDPASGPLLHQPAGYVEPAPPVESAASNGSAANAPATNTNSPATVPANSSSKPWLPLTLTTLALFASLGLNGYLGWIAWGIYRRYRELAEEMRSATA
jgi:hypothetical protein